MVHLTNISKNYGIQTILADISFRINSGERIGLVGPNGSGKTTLLQIITGQIQPDSGHVRRTPAHLEVGHLAQGLQFEPEETVSHVLARLTAAHTEAWNTMQQYATLMATANPDELTILTTAYSQVEQSFEAAGGYLLEARLDEVLAGLGLLDVPRDLLVKHLSGGQKTRLSLAGLLILQPRLLLLDEPTNHLDVEALAWLESWLQVYDGAILIVSHDRAFLDAVTTRTLVLDLQTRTLRDFTGNYSAYLATITHETEQQWQAYKDQQAEITQLRQAVQRLRGQAKMKRGGKADNGDKFAKGHFNNRSTGTVGRAKNIERRIEKLQTEERIERPERQWHLRPDFSQSSDGARQVLRLENIAMSYGQSLLFSQVNLLLTHGQRVVLVGSNGTGKTTLLRIITRQLTPTAGQVKLGMGVKLGYLSQEQEVLKPTSTPYETLRATSATMDQTETRNLLHRFLFSGDQVFVPNSSLSFGERTRLMLALLVAQGCNFLLLDEPLNHLDIPSREQFEQALGSFPGTVLAVVHDRAFIERVSTEIWQISAGQIKSQPIV
ncbi:ABC-F family ATP-binding cassette domain-containing protein [Anaerolineales bacterium HSG6]|nr:ABC-F family ATP-binding cassette domain-containing protein [Anaerolineales bacterium HSG6]